MLVLRHSYGHDDDPLDPSSIRVLCGVHRYSAWQNDAVVDNSAFGQCNVLPPLENGIIVASVCTENGLLKLLAGPRAFVSSFFQLFYNN
jgi:hypothetical protein